MPEPTEAPSAPSQERTGQASTPKGERRRQALVEAASELLVESGFAGIRHRAVAERAGLPLASTTYYFSSIEELVERAVEYHGRTELAWGRERLSGCGRLDRDELCELVLDMLLGHNSRDGGLDVVLLRYERLVGSGRRPYLAPLMREMGDELHALLVEILAQAGAPSSSAEVTRLIALIDGTVVNALIESDPDPRGAARRVLRAELP
ncbi:TetR family transcriptional regulator C-terminal domain-containing protein [Allokutzneria sp. A3M-2-11 16]|uniref:TetR/AcrR family transcriptional regulator n=1 Tax=Allokutzneria sp. A3M-2-11 16 TaxID=2962043 RepID=UPI0020B829C1|nr:TetR family transcriptional regulator C-terminal domain-containing protein [Allokutzneria sp. A3M-2-11 16]MCP3799237.1 TetR family transcriptional regulator C-terminal domain-containing protein [Allokutzneria sp. A3M-2-11 16]